MAMALWGVMIVAVLQPGSIRDYCWKFECYPLYGRHL
jgi:hypothetical protein